MNTSETAKQAAKQLAEKPMKQGYKPEALHHYTDEQGNSLFWRIRLKHHETGDKWIRPMHWNGSTYVIGEPSFASGKPLYNLQQLSSLQDEAVVICEGEYCADALIKLDIVATTSGGAGSAEKINWNVLAKQHVIIWPDYDEAGQRYATNVINQLKRLDCKIQVIDVAQLKLPVKGDVINWLVLNSEAKKQDIFALPMIDINQNQKIEHVDEPEKKSQASLLVDYVVNRADLFHDNNADSFSQDKNTKETHRLDSRQFKDWLVSSFYQSTGKSPRDQSLREALSTLSGLARYQGECKTIYVRAAQHDGKYYLDLGQAGNSHAIEISAGSWRMIDEPPVHFLRPNTLQALPNPIKHDDLSMLWEMINIPDDARLLVTAWLAECLRTDTPFPILEFIGEQGSAKSTTQTMLRQLIDPNACDLRASPKTVEDIFVSAGSNWLVSYENVSHLSSAMQDALCVLATGGGFAKRKLYSDADETVINVKRPIILNGISAAITAQDLVDRTLSVEMPVINTRMEMTELWKTYQAKQANILGALLNIMSKALALLPTISLPSKNQPRLIEFVKFGMAIAEAMGEPGENFLTQFQASRQESIARTLDASPVASALMEWFEKVDRRFTQLSVKDLFNGVAEYKSSHSDAWPRSAKGFADAMRRAAPALRQIGIECTCIGKIGSYVYWEISNCE